MGEKSCEPYLAREGEKMDKTLLEGITSSQDWARLRSRYKEYYYKLSLEPMSERTPLAPTIKDCG